MKAVYLFEINQVAESHAGQVAICICRDCRIEFLTSRSNAKRDDMRCIFGCREFHRRQASNRRSVEYYQTETGHKKKKTLNKKRSKCGKPERPKKPAASSAVYQYYRWLILVVDGVRIGVDAICIAVADILNREVRQHSLEKFDVTWQLPDS